MIGQRPSPRDADEHGDFAEADAPEADDAQDVGSSGSLITGRRLLVAGLNLATITGLFAALYSLLSVDGIDTLDAIILAGFALATPWTVLGFWNAVIGLFLLHGSSRPEDSVYPYYQANGDRPRVASRVALTVFLRNEDPEPIAARLLAMRESLLRNGAADRFRFFLLSDTDDPGIARREHAVFDAFQARFERGDPMMPIYRRRLENSRHKTGNLWDFLDRWGDDFDFFLPLDFDSVMSADVMVRMTATMERNPQIGILQSLVVGMPASSGFARLFQFGMRHGMRSFTIGSAWWSGDCGPYWGHNALIRTNAFRAHCELPMLPGKPPLGGAILSHDQLEAVFMRRAGYEVRVIPVETQSYETNPPTLPDFAKRDLRWCQGNMQYWRFLVMRNLNPVSRFQLLQAILMYLAPPAWIAMTLAATAKAMTSGMVVESVAFGIGLFLVIFGLSISPKIAGVIDVLLTRGGVKRYGGFVRFAGGAFVELIASMLLAPIVAVYITIFLAGLPFGYAVTWSGQNRDALGIGWASAAKAMAPQTVLGVVLGALFLNLGTGAFLWSLPFVAGLALSIPFTVLTGSQALGRAMAASGLCAIPEETALPRVLTPVVGDETRRWRRHVRQSPGLHDQTLAPATEAGRAS